MTFGAGSANCCKKITLRYCQYDILSNNIHIYIYLVNCIKRSLPLFTRDNPHTQHAHTYGYDHMVLQPDSSVLKDTMNVNRRVQYAFTTLLSGVVHAEMELEFLVGSVFA